MAKAEKKPAATSEGAAVANVPVSVTVTDPVKKLMAETGMSKAEATARVNAPTLVEQPENKTE